MKGFRKSHAVVIGIDGYLNGIPRLQTAVNDALGIAEILESNFRYEVDLRTEHVSAEELRDLFSNELPKKVEADDRVLIYFAGHGIAMEGEDGPTGYLIPQDAWRDDRGTFLPMTDLNGWLNALPCRHMLLVLDCCFAGAFRWASTRDMGPPPGEIYKERFDRFIRDPAWQVLTSAAHDQKALDTLGDRGVDKDLPNHSPFAAALIRGLTGAADAYPKRPDNEKSGDGVITASELYMYLRDSVEVSAEAIDHRQTPGLWPLKKHDRGEFIHLIPGYELNLKPAPPLDENANPYRGLQSYDIEHASLFFGRKAVVRKLARRVEEQPLTIVLGASGTGKSSVVKAGLVSYLRNPKDDSDGPVKPGKNAPDPGPPIDHYRILKPIRPGKSPLTSLNDLAFAKTGTDDFGSAPDPLKTVLESLKTDSAALSATIGQWFEKNAEGKLLLIVDQFEELITLCTDEAERTQFLKQLKKAIETHRDRLRVVVTLRNDFQPQFTEFEAFAKTVRPTVQVVKADRDAIAGPNFIVPALTPEEYREVIEGPASVKVLYFKGREKRSSLDFIDRLIGDIANTPGALPLLSFTLSELYRSYIQSGSDDRALQEEDYEALGGVGGALRNRAESIYENLPDEAHRETMKKVMLRMISAEGGGLARRRAKQDELKYASAAEDDRVATVLAQLVAARLVIPDKDESGNVVLEPAHDKLINGWNRLLEWSQRELTSLQLRELLNPAVEDWSRDRDHGKLWSDNPRLSLLAEELGLPNRWYSYQYHKLKAFYEREAESELIEFEIPSWMKKLTPKIESKPTWLNSRESQFVQESLNRRHAWTTTVVVLTLMVFTSLSGITWYANSESVRANLNARTSRVNEEKAKEQTIFANKARTQAELSAANANVTLASILLDRSKEVESQRKLELVPADYRGIGWGIQKYKLIEGEPFVKQGAPINSVSFSPDGKKVASASVDNSITIWDAVTGSELKRLEGHTHWVNSISWSPDGQSLASGARDNSVRIWDVSGKTETKVLGCHDSTVTNVSWSPDGRRLASGSSDETIRIWNIMTGESRRIKGHTQWIISVNWSPDGSKLVSSSGDNTIRIWDAELGNELYRVEGNRTSNVVWSPDGSRIAYGIKDNSVRIWDLQSKQETNRLIGHKNMVTRVAWSPDGTKIASGGSDFTIRVWNIMGSDQVRELAGHSDQITSLCWSSDGRWLASGSRDKSIRIWGISLSYEADVLNAHSQQIRSISWSPDGKFLASGSQDNTIRLWDTRTRSLIKELRGHDESIWCISFSPNGRLIASASDDNTVRVWEVNTGKLIKCLKGHSAAVWALTWSTDGSRLATGSGDFTVKIWDLEKGVEIHTLAGHKDVVYTLCWSPDGKLLATGSWDKTIKIWRTDKNDNPIATLSRHDNQVTCLAWTPDGKSLASGSVDNTIKLWDIQALTERFSIHVESGIVASLDVDPSGKSLVAGIGNGEILFIDLILGQIVATRKNHKLRVLSVKYSPNGQWIASGSDDGTLRKMYVSPESDVNNFLSANINISSVVLSKNHNLLAIGAYDHSVYLRNAITNEHLSVYKGHKGHITSIDFSTDASRLISASADKSIIIWSVVSGRSIFKLIGHSAEVNSVAFSPDAKLIASGSKDNTIRLWDCNSGTELSSLLGHTGSINRVSWSNDGKRLASCSDDGYLKIWDASEMISIHSIRAHGDSVTAIAWSADSRLVATGSRDKSIKIWDAVTGSLITTLSGHNNNVTCLAWSFDSKTLISGSSDQTLKVWDYQTLTEVCSLDFGQPINSLYIGKCQINYHYMQQYILSVVGGDRLFNYWPAINNSDVNSNISRRVATCFLQHYRTYDEAISAIRTNETLTVEQKERISGIIQPLIDFQHARATANAIPLPENVFQP